MKFTKFLLKQASKILGFLIVKHCGFHKLCRHIRAVFGACSFSFMEYPSHFIVLMAGGTILSLLLFVEGFLGLR